MKLHLAYIPLFLITFQNIDSEKEIPGKYIGHSLYGGTNKINLKDNGKLVVSGYSISLKRKRNEFYIPPPGNMPQMPPPMDKTKKSRFRTKGSWVYFKKDSLPVILLKTNSHTDTLFLLQNGNLSPNRPNANEIIKTVVNGNTLYTRKYATFRIPDEYVKQ
ncbi:hypothetical protein DNU06_16885 [Putridiphycobacter roseus]|uniref:Uncharacterized protein n=1 Tax=Putridiphycobacter roseus TaxID=2219161 RepID=A0A2W1NJ85_9FLAO|nr:hypothetical protein [Putridiphycobacter roseus]PZE15682.1 hypothetical protein DNU06_16885 [Putridiphycobacter roseus]